MATLEKGKGTHTLILVRHGESEWNKSDQFSGWVDVKLTEKGRAEAKRAGELLRDFDLKPDIVHTSRLTRTIVSANITLESANRSWIDVKQSWRLNERHYGALQGRNKKQIAEEFGHEKFMTWRRSFDVPPPRIKDDDKYSQVHDERYKLLPPDQVPRSESLKLVIERLLPYWCDVIAKELYENKTVLVVAHGNSLRALIKHLDNVTEEEIAGVNIPTGIPFVYELDDKLRPVKDRFYLDPQAALAGAAAVANQGK